MTPRARRLVWGSSIAAAVLLLAAFGAWWVLYTEPGAKWGFERLGGLFPGRLDAREVSGPLRGPLILRHFTYRSERLAITADSVAIDWRLGQLGRRRLDIRGLRADNVRVVIGGPGDTPEARDSLAGLPDLDLPVTVVLRDGVIHGLTFARPGSDSGVVIDRVVLDARSVRGDSLHVNRLSVRSRTVDLDFSGVAFPHGAYPVNLTGAWAYRLPDGAAIRGEGTMAGTFDTLRVRQRLAGAVAADVDMLLFRPLRRLRYQGDVSFRDLALRDLRSDLPGGTYTGQVSVRGDARDLAAHGHVRTVAESFGAATADFRVRREGAAWRIDEAVVTRPGLPGRLAGRGRVTADGKSPVRFDLDAEWTAMGWPLRGEPWVRSERGTATIRGTSADFDVRLRALLAGRDVPSGSWTLDGRGGNGRLAVRTVVADIFEGRIVGRGSVAWEPRVSWNLTFDGRGIDPGAVWPAYPGSIAFTGRSQGTQESGGPSGRILVSRLTGTVRGQPVTASGSLTARRGAYSLANAVATWGPNRIEANGGFGRTYTLDWKVDAPRIGAALAQASGSLRGEGTIRGARRQPRFTATVTGDSLFLGDAHVNALRAEADVDLRPGGVIRLEAAATRVHYGSHAAERLIVSGSGTRDRNEWRASLASRTESTVVALAGGFENRGWRGDLRTLDLVHPRTGRWSLASPAALAAVDGRVTLEGFVWQSGTSRILAEADWARRGPWRLETRLEQVDLTLLQPALPPRLQLQGTMQGHATARGSAEGRVYADVDVVPTGSVLHRATGGQWLPTRLENARLRATADGVRVEANATADLVNTGSVRGRLGWPAYGSFASGTSRPLDGRVTVHLRDLGLVQGLTPELDATTGTLDADLEVAGTVDHPFLYGPLTLRNGSAHVPRFGLRLQELNLEGRGTRGGAIALHGTVRSGAGTLAIDGSASVARGARPVATVTVKGDRVQAMNTSDMNLIASPDLRFSLNGNRLDVTGQVVVPQGRIDLGSQDEERLVRPSPDVVFVGADTLTGAPIETYARVRIVLGDRVRVTGFGLDVKPTGSILAVDSPGLPTRGTGRFDIEDGTYRIYGQELAVRTGSLIFGGGPIVNPAVRARAIRTASDGVVAGFIVSGTVTKPEVQVFSEPAMGQSQALSYVMFGKPIESANVSEGQMASTLATMLGVPGTNLLAQGVASEVGIESASVNIGSTFESASVALGTHLSPKLYVSAGMDVFQATSSLRLRYILNRIFTIEAETARQNRIDVLYTVEP